MSRAHKGFKVKQHKPWKLWVSIIMVLLLFWGFFVLGQAYQSYQLMQLDLERATLLSKIDELESRNHTLVKNNAQLEGSSKIENDAYQRASRTLVKLQRQILAQKEELIFYQGIVSPANAALGVNLQSFQVKSKSNQKPLSYKLVLTRQGKISRKLRGSVKITIRGEDAGGVKEYKLSNIRLENPGKATKFNFKYFQVFEGDIAFPEEFTPFEVEIDINATTKKVKSFTETISWARVMLEDS
jgi:cell division protein FtsB